MVIPKTEIARSTSQIKGDLLVISGKMRYLKMRPEEDHGVKLKIPVSHPGCGREKDIICIELDPYARLGSTKPEKGFKGSRGQVKSVEVRPLEPSNPIFELNPHAL